MNRPRHVPSSLAFSLLITLSVASLSTPARADIIEVSVSGIISDSLDDGNFMGYGAGYNTLAGMTITQTFRYDTHAAVVNYEGGVPGGNGDPRAVFYIIPGPNNTLLASWISVETTINGVVLPTPVEEPRPEFQAIADGLTLWDKWDEPAGSFFKDFFDVSVSAVHITEQGGNRTYDSLSTHASAETFYNVVNGVGLLQSFDLDIAREYFSGGGHLEAGRVTVDSNGERTSSSGVTLNYIGHRYTVGSLTPVPIPAGIWLLGSAVAALAGIRLRVGSHGR